MIPLPQSSAYNEYFIRGTLDFPFDFHLMNRHHPRFYMPFHYHIDLELIRVVNGGVTMNLNERRYYLKQGDFLFIQDGVVHGGQPDDNDTIYECIVFNLSQIFDLKKTYASWLNKIATHQITLTEYFNKKEQPLLAQNANDFFEAVANKGQENVISVLGNLLCLIGNMIKLNEYSIHKTSSSRYTKHLLQSSQLFRYIFDNYTKDITLEDMASNVGLSSKYFCKFFKELTNCRPMDYLNRFRIECAAIHITTSTESINQIAYACGFKDPCYFTKLFKRYKQISPREFRNIYHNNIQNKQT